MTARLEQTPFEDIWICSVTAEEVIDGRRKIIRLQYDPKTKTIGLGQACENLARSLKQLATFNIQAESDESFDLYRSSLKKARVDPEDCRIASIAILHNLTVVTCNVRDFERVAAIDRRLRIEDWSK